jgi:superfamily I DNA/RNA helicase
MAENGLLSYDGILQSARTYLEGSPPRWGPRRPLFLVDEIQDSSGDDLAIYDALKASGAELWLVGDLQQAIYSFRHRQPANVWAWWGKRPVAELKTNYRSSRAVIKALNLINANFVPRVEIVPAENAVDGEVRLLSSGSEPELLEQLWRRILLLSPTQRPLEQLVDFAVLCRTNRECHLVATMLKGRGMNVREKGGNGSERVPDVLWAALGFFRQPESDWMAKRYLRAIGVDPEATERSAVTAMRTMGQLIYPALFAVERTPFEWFSQSWMDLLQVPKAEQGWFAERLPEGWTDLSWDDITMRLFEAPGEQEKGTGVTVTTVHAAKGREWKHVLMPFADQLSYRPKNGMEEQRVFFVGASRAVQTLTFLFAKSRVDEWQGGETDVAMCEPLERILDGSKGGRKKRKPRS